MSDQKPVNVHINPNLLASSSGSVHINKKMFSVNQNLVRSNVPDSKVHYNPKFFMNNQNRCPSESVCKVDNYSYPKLKTIHLNPSFAPKLVADDQITPNCNFEDDTIYKNFDFDQNSYNRVDNLYCDVDERSVSNFRPEFDKKRLDEPWHVETNLISILPGDVSETTKYQNSLSYSPQYPQTDLQPPAGVKTSKITKYKIRRNCPTRKSPQIKTSYSAPQTPPRKPRLSGSFKKIGQRKLVRKSMIQSYISSRRNSLPTMLQHLRTNMVFKKKLNGNLSQNKYKFVSGCDGKVRPTPKSLKYKSVSIPSKTKLKWNRGDAQKRDFVNFGKRKIVRKSILQSILEARRTKFVSSRKYSFKKQVAPKLKSSLISPTIRSRFKVIRNVGAPHTSQLNINRVKRDSTSIDTKRKEVLGLSQFVTSKSIFFRMPPSLRFKIRLEEKRKRTMLLKKVNNRKKCTYYNRFGFCKGLEAATCKKIHDPKSIAICRKFLKGICDGEGCKLSHNVVPEKMPTCHQFLAGVCVRTSCPFLHVKLSDARPICSQFLQGFCNEGDSCTKRHRFICPEWDESKSCERDKCPYPHPQADVDRNYSKTTNKIKPVANVEEAVQTEVENVSDDTARRYFSERAKTEKLADPKAPNMKLIGKDGTDSVYSNQSLLSFIPFS